MSVAKDFRGLRRLAGNPVLSGNCDSSFNPFAIQASLDV